MSLFEQSFSSAFTLLSRSPTLSPLFNGSELFSDSLGLKKRKRVAVLLKSQNCFCSVLANCCTELFLSSLRFVLILLTLLLLNLRRESDSLPTYDLLFSPSPTRRSSSPSSSPTPQTNDRSLNNSLPVLQTKGMLILFATAKPQILCTATGLNVIAAADGITIVTAQVIENCSVEPESEAGEGGAIYFITTDAIEDGCKGDPAGWTKPLLMGAKGSTFRQSTLTLQSAANLNRSDLFSFATVGKPASPSLEKFMLFAKCRIEVIIKDNTFELENLADAKPILIQNAVIPAGSTITIQNNTITRRVNVEGFVGSYLSSIFIYRLLLAGKEKPQFIVLPTGVATNVLQSTPDPVLTISSNTVRDELNTTASTIHLSVVVLECQISNAKVTVASNNITVVRSNISLPRTPEVDAALAAWRDGSFLSTCLALSKGYYNTSSLTVESNVISNYLEDSRDDERHRAISHHSLRIFDLLLKKTNTVVRWNSITNALFNRRRSTFVTACYLSKLTLEDFCSLQMESNSISITGSAVDNVESIGGIFFDDVKSLPSVFDYSTMMTYPTTSADDELFTDQTGLMQTSRFRALVTRRGGIFVFDNKIKARFQSIRPNVTAPSNFLYGLLLSSYVALKRTGFAFIENQIEFSIANTTELPSSVVTVANFYGPFLRELSDFVDPGRMALMFIRNTITIQLATSTRLLSGCIAVHFPVDLSTTTVQGYSFFPMNTSILSNQLFLKNIEREAIFRPGTDYSPEVQIEPLSSVGVFGVSITAPHGNSSSGRQHYEIFRNTFKAELKARYMQQCEVSFFTDAAVALLASGDVSSIGEDGSLVISHNDISITVDDSLFGPSSKMTPFPIDDQGPGGVVPSLATMTFIHLGRMRVFAGGLILIQGNTASFSVHTSLVATTVFISAGGTGASEEERAVPHRMLGHFLNNVRTATNANRLSSLQITANNFTSFFGNTHRNDKYVNFIGQQRMEDRLMRRHGISFFGLEVDARLVSEGGAGVSSPVQILIERNTMLQIGDNFTHTLWSANRESYLMDWVSLYFQQLSMKGSLASVVIRNNSLNYRSSRVTFDSTLTLMNLISAPLMRASCISFDEGIALATSAHVLISENIIETNWIVLPETVDALTSNLAQVMFSNVATAVTTASFLGSVTLVGQSVIQIRGNILIGLWTLWDTTSTTRAFRKSFGAAIRLNTWRHPLTDLSLDKSTRMPVSFFSFESVKLTDSAIIIADNKLYCSEDSYTTSIVQFTGAYYTNSHYNARKSVSYSMDLVGDSAVLIYGMSIAGRSRSVVTFEPHTRPDHWSAFATSPFRVTINNGSRLHVGCDENWERSVQSKWFYRPKGDASLQLPACRRLTASFVTSTALTDPLPVITEAMVSSAASSSPAGAFISSGWQHSAVEDIFANTDDASTIVLLRGVALDVHHSPSSSPSSGASLAPFAITGWMLQRPVSDEGLRRLSHPRSDTAVSALSFTAMFANGSSVIAVGGGSGAAPQLFRQSILDAAIGHVNQGRLKHGMSDRSSYFTSRLTSMPSSVVIAIANITLALVGESPAGILYGGWSSPPTGPRPPPLLCGLAAANANGGVFATNGAQVVVRGVSVECKACALLALSISTLTALGEGASLGGGYDASGQSSSGGGGGGGGVIQIAHSRLSTVDDAETPLATVKSLSAMSAVRTVTTAATPQQAVSLRGNIRVCNTSVNQVQLLGDDAIHAALLSAIYSVGGGNSPLSVDLLSLDATSCHDMSHTATLQQSVTRSLFPTPSKEATPTPPRTPPHTASVSPAASKHVSQTVKSSVEDADKGIFTRSRSVFSGTSDAVIGPSTATASFNADTREEDGAKSSSLSKSFQHLLITTMSQSFEKQPPLHALPPPKSSIQQSKETAEQVVSAAVLAGGSLSSASSGGQVSVAMAVLRVNSKCLAGDGNGDSSSRQSTRRSSEASAAATEANTDDNSKGGSADNDAAEEGDGDENAVEVLSPFVHPLFFPIGSGAHRYFIGAIVGNCIIIPLLTAAAVRYPLVYVLQRWGLPDHPPTSEVLVYIGWPSILVLPFATLAEGTASAMTELLRANGSAEVLVALIGACALLAVLVAWAYWLLSLYRLPIQLERTVCESWGWFLFVPFFDWAPKEKKETKEAEEGEDEETGNNEESSKSAKLEVSSSSSATASTIIAFSEIGPARLPQRKIPLSEVEDRLEVCAHVSGGKALLFADGVSLFCSVLVGIVEGSGDAFFNCRSSITVLTVFAVVQSLLECTTTAPSEFVIQIAMGTCLVLICVSGLMDNYNGDTSPGFLSEAQSEELGLAINIFGFFGMASGVICAIVRLLRHRPVYKMIHALRRAGRRILSTRRAIRIKAWKKRESAVAASHDARLRGGNSTNNREFFLFDGVLASNGEGKKKEGRRRNTNNNSGGQSGDGLLDCELLEIQRSQRSLQSDEDDDENEIETLLLLEEDGDVVATAVDDDDAMDLLLRHVHLAVKRSENERKRHGNMRVGNLSISSNSGREGDEGKPIARRKKNKDFAVKGAVQLQLDDEDGGNDGIEPLLESRAHTASPLKSRRKRLTTASKREGRKKDSAAASSLPLPPPRTRRQIVLLSDVDDSSDADH